MKVTMKTSATGAYKQKRLWEIREMHVAAVMERWPEIEDSDAIDAAIREGRCGLRSASEIIGLAREELKKSEDDTRFYPHTLPVRDLFETANVVSAAVRTNDENAKMRDPILKQINAAFHEAMDHAMLSDTSAGALHSIDSFENMKFLS